VRIWDLGRRELLRPPLRLPPSVLGLAFSPDGSQLAIPFGAFSDGRPSGVEILDVGSGERVARLSPDGEVRSVAFSPDGSLLAAGRVNGGALGGTLLWATDSWRQVGGPLALPNASTLEVAFSPDGHTLATSHSDGTVVLWDVASQQPIGPPLPAASAEPGSDTAVTARFTPDGARLFVVSGSGRAIRWEVDPAAWRRQACRLMGGDLTPAEWEEIAPEHDYIEVCPSR
jgi:WD40 repeat protein